jgi:hypothetical protein
MMTSQYKIWHEIMHQEAVDRTSLTGFLFLSSLIVPKMYSALQRPEIENKTLVHAAPQDVENKVAAVESAAVGLDVDQNAEGIVEDDIGATVEA